MSAARVLLALWEQSGRRLRDRCRGLTDAEYFWEPVEDCWNIRPNESHVGGWSYEYEFAPEDPAPVTDGSEPEGFFVVAVDDAATVWLCGGRVAWVSVTVSDPPTSPCVRMLSPGP